MEYLATFGPAGDPSNPTLWRDRDAPPDREYLLIDGEGRAIHASREGLWHLVDKIRDDMKGES